jgi:BMFP domain-containing protein YqiC
LENLYYSRQFWSHLGSVGSKGDVTMTVADDKGPAGSGKRHAESATGRIGDDVQRAKENISEAAASARDDIAADLRRLSADVVGLKDTVAELAKAVTAEVGEAATGIGGDVASAAKDQANTLLSEFEVVARRNPLGVVIGAFGIGMLIGIMKGRR